MADSLPWILGLASSHNGAACLLHGSEIVVAIQEERLLRQKRAELPGAFASLSVPYCLNHAQINANQLDAVVLCTSGFATEEREDIYLNEQLQVARNRVTAFVIPHHIGHAVAVYAMSGIPSTGILIIDGRGSPWDELLDSERVVILPGQLDAYKRADRTVPKETASLYLANDGVLEPLEKHIASYIKSAPCAKGLAQFQSLGDMYGIVGQQIFGSFLEGAGKVMGLSPFGERVIPAEEFYRFGKLGFEFQDAVRRRFPYDERWPAHKKEYEDLAASVQKALEEAVLLLCRKLRQSHENLCYAGGVALNSVANERIVREAGFRNVFIMPASEDSGTAIGAAYYGLWKLSGYSLRKRQHLDSVGHSYAESEISSAIRQSPTISAAKSGDIVQETADLLARGKIVGWFQNGSELGPRALGHRSILCDPRCANGKKFLNEKVKFRESFRPFAPVIAEEDVYDWFEVQRPDGSSPFMLRVLSFRKDQAPRVPAVVHVDGTGRVQTVSKHHSPRLYQLLKTFGAKTGVPVLLNTSFNIAGEPIVETPEDAIWCFLYTGMNHCVMGDYLLSKPDSPLSILDVPIILKAESIILYNKRVNGNVDWAISQLSEVKNRVLSSHASRIKEISAPESYPDWMRLLIVVRTRWGEVVHGLPNGIIHILKLIDGNRTGKEIFAQLLANGDYRCAHEIHADNMRGRHEDPLMLFRTHVALLKRIGAISFAFVSAAALECSMSSLPPNPPPSQSAGHVLSLYDKARNAN